MRKNLPIILLSALVVIGLLVGVGYYFQTYRHGKAPEEGLTVVLSKSASVISLLYTTFIKLAGFIG